MIRFASALALVLSVCWLAPTTQAQDLKKLATDVAEQGRIVTEARNALKKSDGTAQRAKLAAAIGEYNALVKAFNHAIAHANRDVAILNTKIAAFNRALADYNNLIANPPKKERKKRG